MSERAACVRMCIHMHVFCMSREEYARLREARRLPSRRLFFPFTSPPFSLHCCSSVSAAAALVQSAAF